MANFSIKYIPAWNAMSLSVSGLALFSLLNPWANSEIDTNLGIPLIYFATFLLVIVTAGQLRSIATDFSHFKESLNTFAHTPIIGAIPASMLVLSAGWGQLGILEVIENDLAASWGFTFAVLGIVATMCFGTTLFSRIAVSKDVDLSQMSGTSFIPAVALVLVPSALIRVAINNNDYSPMLLIFSLFLLGAGLLLFIFLGAVLAHRIISMPPLPGAQSASWWIWLAPMGAGGLGLIASSRYAANYFSQPLFADLGQILATGLWGFGVWWLIFALKTLYWTRTELKFNFSYWGFGFPTAAFGALTVELGKSWQYACMQSFGAILWVSLVVLVVWLTFKTLEGIRMQNRSKK